MSNITSTTLQRITNISQINTNDYYLLKDRIEKRSDYIGYFLTDDEIKKIQGNQYPSKSFFRKIWLRIPRNSETDKYDEWKNVREIQKSNNQINEYLFVTSNNIRNDKVLIYSFGDEMQKLLNEDDNPDLLYQLYQYLQQRERKSNVNEEINKKNENETMSNEDFVQGEPNTLQYLASKNLIKHNTDDAFRLKNDTNINPWEIMDHTKSKKGGKSNKRKGRRKSKQHRKYQKTRKYKISYK